MLIEKNAVLLLGLASH